MLGICQCLDRLEPSLPVASSTYYVPLYSPSPLCFQEICWNFSWWPFPAFFFAVSLCHFNPFIVILMTVSEDKYICWVRLLFSHCPVWLCNPMDYSQAPLSMGFPRQEYWSGSLFPSLEKPWEAQATPNLNLEPEIALAVWYSIGLPRWRWW